MQDHVVVFVEPRLNAADRIADVIWSGGQAEQRKRPTARDPLYFSAVISMNSPERGKNL